MLDITNSIMDLVATKITPKAEARPAFKSDSTLRIISCRAMCLHCGFTSLISIRHSQAYFRRNHFQSGKTSIHPFKWLKYNFPTFLSSSRPFFPSSFHHFFLPTLPHSLASSITLW